MIIWSCWSGTWHYCRLIFFHQNLLETCSDSKRPPFGTSWRWGNRLIRKWQSSSFQVLHISFYLHAFFKPLDLPLLQWKKLVDSIWFKNFPFHLYIRFLKGFILGPAGWSFWAAPTTSASCVSPLALLTSGSASMMLSSAIPYSSSWLLSSAGSEAWLGTEGILICSFLEENMSTRNKSCL